MTALTTNAEALKHSKDAKAALVKDEGIGTDLAPSVLAWKDGQLIGLATLADPHPTPSGQTVQTLTAITTIAHGWDVDAISVVKEGYAARRDAAHDDRPLAERFATDPGVHECLTVCTVTTDAEAVFTIQPYTVGFGKVVQWHDHDTVSVEPDEVPVTSIIYACIHDAIEARTGDDPDIASTTLEHLGHLGFDAAWGRVEN